MASITSVGTGSGLELESLITDIVNAERAPVQARLDSREARVQASISALGSLKSSLSDFQTALGKLKDASAFGARTTTSSDTTLFTATGTNSAELGNYNIGVVQMAKTHKLGSANFANSSTTVGSGSLNIAVDGGSFNVDITAGVNDSLAGIRDAINNATGNDSVRASLLTVSDGAGGTATKLVLTSSKSGADNAITVTATDSDGNNTDNSGLSRLVNANLTEAEPAQDAIITVDGFETRSSSNVFADTIPGVSLTVLKQSEEVDETLSGQLAVTENKSGIKSAIEAFVVSYNALNGVFRQLTGADASGTSRGLLSGDSSVNVAQSRLRSMLGGAVEGAASDFDSLSALGIRTERDGSISLDGAKLDAALANRYEDLTALFSGSEGLAGKLDKTISGMIGSGGMFDIRNESLTKQLDDIGDQRTSLALRLEKVEARYRAQFSALDILVAQLDQTGSFLTQQLEATAQMINGRNN